MGEGMSIWNPKKNTIFEVALNKINSLVESLNSGNIELIQNKWMRIIPNDENSPMIMGMGDNKHMIYYPPNSTPYLHQYETSIKFIEILSGKLTDELTGKVYEKGHKLKIYPGEEYKPYTNDSAAYIRVCVTKIDDIWTRVCEK